MKLEIIQPFRGKIEGIEFTTEGEYTLARRILLAVEEKFGKVINPEVVKKLKDSIEMAIIYTQNLDFYALIKINEEYIKNANSHKGLRLKLFNDDVFSPFCYIDPDIAEEKETTNKIEENSISSIFNSKPNYSYQVLWVDNKKNTKHYHDIYKTEEKAYESIWKWWKLNDYSPPYVRLWRSGNTINIDYGSHWCFYKIIEVNRTNLEA